MRLITRIDTAVFWRHAAALIARPFLRNCGLLLQLRLTDAEMSLHGAVVLLATFLLATSVLVTQGDYCVFVHVR